MEPEEYQCEHCKGIFTKVQDEDDATVAEFAENFPDTPKDEELAIICDDCYKAFMRWMLVEQ